MNLRKSLKMEEKENNNQEEKSETVKVSVYLDSKLLAKIDNYWKKKMCGSRSELFRKAFETDSHIFPLHSHESERKSLGELLEENRDKLDAINLKLEMMEKQEKLNLNTEKILELRKQETHNMLKNVPLNNIPDFKNISGILLNLIQESEGKGVKDFVLMEHMRALGYSESTIWLILYKLEEMGNLNLRDGVWKIV